MNTDNVQKYLRIGAKDKFWYQECEDTLVSIFGRDQLKLVVNLLAATSINTSLKSNITLFRRAYREFLDGKPISNYLPNIEKQLRQIRAGQELTGPKIRSFAASMSGDVNAVVVDIWILRAFGRERRYYRKGSDSVRSGGATGKDYRLIETYIREEAPKFDLEPRQMCSMIWSGVRIAKGGDSQTRYTDILKQQYINSLFPLEL